MIGVKKFQFLCLSILIKMIKFGDIDVIIVKLCTVICVIPLKTTTTRFTSFRLHKKYEYHVELSQEVNMNRSKVRELSMCTDGMTCPDPGSRILSEILPNDVSQDHTIIFPCVVRTTE